MPRSATGSTRSVRVPFTSKSATQWLSPDSSSTPSALPCVTQLPKSRRADILSQERAGVGGRIQQLMTTRVEPRGIFITDFFLRGINPPETIRVAVEQKLAREQQVEAEAYQTQVVSEQANQRRAEAAGIRDAQNIIAASLIGEAGRAYLSYEGLQALKAAATGGEQCHHRTVPKVACR